MAARPERKLTRRRYSRQSGRAAHPRACHEMSCSVMRCRKPPCSAEFQFGFGQRRQASRLHPLPLPLRRPVHPDSASHKQPTTLPPRSTPHCHAPNVEERLLPEAGGAAVAEDFDLPAIIFLRQRLRYIAASDGPRTCHEMSCSVMRCHAMSCFAAAPPLSDCLAEAPLVSILHAVPPSRFVPFAPPPACLRRDPVSRVSRGRARPRSRRRGSRA